MNSEQKNHTTIGDHRAAGGLHAAPEFVVDCITRPEDFQRLEPQWREIMEASRSASLFTNWAWVSTWWDVYGEPDFRLNVLICRQGNAVVGIAPFVLATQTLSGLASLRWRILRFLGTGEPEADEVATEYPDLLARPGAERAVAECIADWLAKRQGRDWDIAQFDNVLKDSVVEQHLLSALALRGRKELVQSAGFRYWIALPASWEEYLDGLSKNFRHKILVSRRRMLRAGSVDIETLRSGAIVDTVFDRMSPLHSSRWNSKGKVGVFGSPHFVLFHQKLLCRQFGNGSPALWFIKLDGDDLAALYNFELGDMVYFYQSGLAANRTANYSPGVVAASLAIEDAIHKGRRVFDFMKGGEQSYKKRYNCATTPMYNITVTNHTPRGWLAYLLLNIRKYLRKQQDTESSQSQNDDDVREEVAKD